MFPMAEPYVSLTETVCFRPGNVSFCFEKHKMPFGLCRFMRAGFTFYLIPLRQCPLLRVLWSEARGRHQEHLCFRTGDNSCFVKPET